MTSSAKYQVLWRIKIYLFDKYLLSIYYDTRLCAVEQEHGDEEDSYGPCPYTTYSLVWETEKGYIHDKNNLSL